MYSDPADFGAAQLRMLRHACSTSTLDCARVFFRQRENMRMIISAHHRIVAATLDRVFSGEIKRLIINIPPGYTKTELAVLSFVARGFLVNPGARFIHASYSADLASRNSALIKRIIRDPLYQAIQPTDISLADGYWTTDHGGHFLAASSGGQITGFRAGTMDKERFTGALIIDDPIKPQDAFSRVERDKINRNFDNTFRSRLAHEGVPIIIIMQRVHQNDMTGFLLSGGAGDRWHHLSIPAMVPAEPLPYPEAWSHGTPVPYQLPSGPLWPFKHNADELETIRAGDSFAWGGQYQQNPADVGSQIFPRSRFPRWETGAGVNWDRRIRFGGELVKIEYATVYADTAMKTGQSNDFSVFQLWGRSLDHIFLLDQVRGKWEAPELYRQMVDFAKKWCAPGSKFQPRAIKIEDKASGTGLIQSMNEAIRRGEFPAPYIEAIQRNTDKVSRAKICAPYVDRGLVVVPDVAPWVEGWLSEVETFTETMTHAHDDQVDPMLDAVTDMLISAPFTGYDAIVG
jgi:predicted phage terminase large subunit-like protein